MLAALTVMSKARIEIAGHFAISRERGNIAGLALLKVQMRERLILPCVTGVAAAVITLPLYFDSLITLGGLLIASALTDLTVAELAERFALQLDLTDLLGPTAKRALPGLALGAVTAYHGPIGPAGREFTLAYLGRTHPGYVAPSAELFDGTEMELLGTFIAANGRPVSASRGE